MNFAKSRRLRRAQVNFVKRRINGVLWPFAAWTLGACGGGGAHGGTGNHGATGGSIPASLMNKAEACVRYTLAVCERHEDCSGQLEDDCFESTKDCPDSMFSEGSTRTIEGLLQCANIYPGVTCHDVTYDQVPSCVTPGTLEAGAVCAFSSQCASLDCVGSPCGTCARIGGAGEPCTDENVACGPGLYCDGSECVPPPDPNAQPEFGDPCTDESDCPVQSSCDIAPGSTTGTCTRYPDLGQSCSGVLTCRSGNYCDPDLTCHLLPPLGAPCGVDALTGQARWCEGDLICHPDPTVLNKGTCGGYQGEDAPCLLDATGTPVPATCSSSLYCDTLATPPTCVGPSGEGEPCSPERGAHACDSSHHCLCVDDACTAHACIELGSGGDRCDGVYKRCHPAYECDGGVCTPRDSQGLAAACTP